MNVSELRAEISRLHEAIRLAAEKSKMEDIWKDKINAGLLRVELILKKLRGGK